MSNTTAPTPAAPAPVPFTGRDLETAIWVPKQTHSHITIDYDELAAIMGYGCPESAQDAWESLRAQLRKLTIVAAPPPVTVAAEKRPVKAEEGTEEGGEEEPPAKKQEKKAAPAEEEKVAPAAEKKKKAPAAEKKIKQEEETEENDA